MHGPRTRRPSLRDPRTGASWRLAGLGVAILMLAAPGPTRAQDTGGIRSNALRVFLDCDTFRCDSEYFRTEVGFVNWVRDRTLAQVHLIVTRDRTGGGGGIYTLDFVGLDDLEDDDDRLTLTVPTTATEDEILSGLSDVIAAGLARYSAAVGQSRLVEISAAPSAPTDHLVGPDQVEDPWNFWVFEVSADVELEGEDTESERTYETSFEARRTTETWKVELEADGSVSRDERELGDGSLSVDERTNWSVDVLVAKAIADHWSVGVIAGGGGSTRRNQDFGADVAAALEFSFFPYADAPRESLTARYDLRLQYFDWEEETIFFETAELRPRHQLRLELFQRQPWGESRVSVDANQFLHDLSKWSLSLSGNLEFRIVGGLNLDVRADYDVLEDQIFVSREGLTDEEILLGRFERPTDSSYEIEIGLSFEFGSIFNNVVNNRFDSRDFGR